MYYSTISDRLSKARGNYIPNIRNAWQLTELGPTEFPYVLNIKWNSKRGLNPALLKVEHENLKLLRCPYSTYIQCYVPVLIKDIPFC